MTIAIIPLVLAAVGVLVYALTDGKLSEIGRLLFFVGLFWLAYSLSSKALHLSSLGDLVEGTAHAQVAEEAGSSTAAEVPDDDVPEPTADDPSSPIDNGAPDVDAISAAVRSGRWMVAAGMILLGLVWLVRTHGSRLLGERFGSWIRTDRGGIAVSTVLGIAASMGLAMAAGRAPSIEDLVAGLSMSTLASGMYVQGRRIVTPSASGGAAVPPPEPEADSKKPRAKRASTTAEG